MQKDEVVALFKKMGLHVRANKTGHPDWTHIRVFQPLEVPQPNHLGTYICIAKFLNGGLYSTKWHATYNESVELEEYHSYATRFRIFRNTGTYISFEKFKTLLKHAQQLADLDKQAKLKKCKELEVQDIKKFGRKKPKKRSAIKGKSVANCLKVVTELYIKAYKGE